MKKRASWIMALGIMSLALSSTLSYGAALTPVTVTAAAAVPKAGPAPTPKPLYVDYTPPDWAKGWDHVTFEMAKKYHTDSKVLFLDARAKVEYDQGHIPGAIPLPAGETDKYYAMYEKKIKKAKKLVTYCHGIGCRLSEKSAKYLADKGHKNVAVFFGGWPQWNEHKMPVETGDPHAPKVTPAPQPTALPEAGKK